jgi:hypothetical protein
MALGRTGGDTLLFGSYFPAILVVTLMSGPVVGGFALLMSLSIVWWAFIPPISASPQRSRSEEAS